MLPVLVSSSLSLLESSSMSTLSPSLAAIALPQPLTRMCLWKILVCECLMVAETRLTLSASFLLKLLSHQPQGKGLTAKWMRLCLFRS